MLLTSLIGSFQNQYADIQAQIEELQEQQRKIQAYLQQLGSVESQMVSAVQMLQEAIASINEVCPDQLAEYQETVVGLFSVPVAALEASQPEAQPEPEPETTPSPSQPETQPDPNPEPEPERSNLVNFPGKIEVTTEAETIKQDLFKFQISHYGDYITYWKQQNDDLVTQMFKDLKIRPRDKKPSEGYNSFGGDGVVLYAYLTSKAFGKIEDKAEYLDADKLD